MTDNENGAAQDPATTMLGMWARMQQQSLENWTKLMSTSSFSPNLIVELAGQWQEVQRQSWEAWTSNTVPLGQDMVARIIDGQAAMLRMGQLITDAWQTLGAKVSAGEEWEPSLEGYTHQLRERVQRLTDDAAQASQDAQGLWQGYLQQLHRIGQPWLEAVAMKGTDREEGTVAVLDRLFDAYEHTFGRLVDIPALGLSREVQEKVAAGFAAWQELQRAHVAYQSVVAETWVVALQRFMHRVVERVQRGEELQGLRQLVRLWTDSADDVFTETFRTDAYIQAQGQLLEAGMRYRQRRRELLEYVQRANDVPTRTEVDELARYAFDHRKEIRTLRQAVQGLRADAEAQSKAFMALKKEFAKMKKEASGLRKEVTDLKKELNTLQKAGTSADAKGAGSKSSGRKASKSTTKKKGEAKKAS